MADLRVGSTGWGALLAMHGRSDTIIDPRTSTMPMGGERRLFSDQADTASTKRKAKRDMFGKSHEG